VANTFLTIDTITKEALRIAHEKAVFIGSINRQFDKSWSSEGATGNTLRIRYPAQYTRRQGSAVMDVQDSVHTSTSLVVATQDGVDMKFTSAEQSQDLNSFSRDFIEPAIASLVSGIDSDVLIGCTKESYKYATNSFPTPFTANTPTTDVSSLTVAQNARTRLNQGLAPKGDRFIQMDSGTMGQMVTNVAAYFNPSNAISKQYREGLVARTAMADYYENERVWSMATLSAVALSSTKLNGYVSTLGQTSMNVSLLTQAQTVGAVFTMANVFDVHPETKQQYQTLKQFVVTAVTDASTYTISPALYRTGPRQNVSGNGTSTSTSAITFLGTTSRTIPQSLMYHRDAFTFATAALPMMADAAKCSVRTFDGLSLRCWQGSDIRNDEMLTRIDILYGYKVIRPEWACRIVGSGSL